jgi:hypothetical protein
MDDIKIIVWIIIGLLYLFSRRKKAETPPPVSRREQPEETTSEQRPAPKSFEELLREIEGMKAPAPPPLPQTRYEPVVDYDEGIPDEQQDLEEIKPSYRSDDEIYKTYEQAKAQAFARPSLEETVKLSDTIVRFKQFKGYEKETQGNLLGEYLKELRDPKGFKKAFVMSEILKRKW